MAQRTNQGPQPTAPVLHGVELMRNNYSFVEKLENVVLSSSHDFGIKSCRRTVVGLDFLGESWSNVELAVLKCQRAEARDKRRAADTASSKSTSDQNSCECAV